MRQAYSAVLAILIAAPSGSALAQKTMVFDLADALVGGSGSLPGLAIESKFPINSSLTFQSQPGLKWVDGNFVPLASGLTTIDSSGTTFDFSSFVGGTSPGGAFNDGGPGNGLNNTVDPSGVNGNPDYTGNPKTMSYMTCHASTGVTFDLDVIRQVADFDLFSANVGGACAGLVNYFVLFDGQVAASGGGLNNAAFEEIRLSIPPGVRFLTLATGDDNQGTINCAHGFYGNPFLIKTVSKVKVGSLVSIQPVGLGCAGNFPFGPHLTADQLPLSGNAAFKLRVEWTAPFQPSLLYLSQGESQVGPLSVGNGCDYFLDIASTLSFVQGGLSPLGPKASGAEGTVEFDFPISPNPILLGTGIGFQCFTIDPMNPGGFTLSNALVGTIDD